MCLQKIEEYTALAAKSLEEVDVPASAKVELKDLMNQLMKREV